MDSRSYKTISLNAATVQKEWVVIDATNEVLGRLASQVAKILRGKNKLATLLTSIAVTTLSLSTPRR